MAEIEFFSVSGRDKRNEKIEKVKGKEVREIAKHAEKIVARMQQSDNEKIVRQSREIEIFSMKNMVRPKYRQA